VSLGFDGGLTGVFVVCGEMDWQVVVLAVRSVEGLVGWCVGGLVGWLLVAWWLGGLVGWLVGWWVGGFVGWWVGRLVGVVRGVRVDLRTV